MGYWEMYQWNVLILALQNKRSHNPTINFLDISFSVPVLLCVVTQVLTASSCNNTTIMLQCYSSLKCS